MLADNRDVIADILEGLAYEHCAAGECVTEAVLLDGAALLRYTYHFDTEATDDEVAELEHLRMLVGGIESVLDTGNKAHPGTKLRAIADLVGEVTR